MKVNELFPDVLTEDNKFEFKAALNAENPVKWAKTIVAFANGAGGFIFIGVSNDREAFGLDLKTIDETKNLIALVNNRFIFPHAKLSYMLRSVDTEAERFVLVVKVLPSESIVRYREGDFNETVYIKGDGNAVPASPEEIVSLSKRKYGVDNETSDILFQPKEWTDYFRLCKEFRQDEQTPSLKEMQNEEVISKDGFAKTGLLMFKDDYDSDDSLICCRLWKGLDKSGIALDSDRFKGPLSTVFSKALQFIERNTKSGWEKLSNGGRRELRSYPKEAVREALVNAIAHRDYSISGTQIDVDIYDDRIDIVSPGSWLLPRKYEEYPLGSIPSIRRNTIIAACLDLANLMERGGTGFKTMIDSYRDADENKQPGVLIYPGFLDLRLYDRLYQQKVNVEPLSGEEIVLEMLKDGAKSVKEMQTAAQYKSRSKFLTDVINPLIDANRIERVGKAKSPTGKIRLKQSQI